MGSMLYGAVAALCCCTSSPEITRTLQRIARDRTRALLVLSL
jgi:hypothetical protein